MREQGLLTAPVQPYSFDCLEGDSVLKNPFAPISAPGSEAQYASFVVFWPCLWPHLDRRPGQQRLFQHAGEFCEIELLIYGVLGSSIIFRALLHWALTPRWGARGKERTGCDEWCVLAAMALALLLASGAALALTKIGTNGPDTLRGTNGNDNLLVHIQSRFRVMSYSSRHEASDLCT